MRASFFSVALFLAALLPALAEAQEQQPAPGGAAQTEWIRMVSPAENAVAYGRNPVITAELTQPIQPQSLIIILDSTDITQLAVRSDSGFEYVPVGSLAPGEHTLSITATDSGGQQLQKNVSFTSRRSENFDEAYSKNEASVIYEAAVARPDEVKGFVPSSKLEGSLRSESRLKVRSVEITLTGSLRYFDQNVPLAGMGGNPAVQKGLTIMDYLLSVKHTGDNFLLVADLGNVQLNETQNTVAGLARQGGRLTLQYKDFTLVGFDVLGKNVFGFKEGFGIEGTTTDHIMGGSASLKLLDRKVEIKTVYVNGGEPGSSVGISSVQGAKKGEAAGAVLITDFFQNKFRTEFEADYSKFDPDTSDEFKEKGDNAYLLKAGGTIDRYSYEAMYQYFGRDYTSIGSQMAMKDREGVTARAGANLGVHNVGLTFVRMKDNVESDPLFPRIVNTQGSVDYSLSAIPNVPIGVNLQASLQESEDEPEGSVPMDLRTDTITGRVGYMAGPLNLNFQAAYTKMNDRTETDSDTTNVTYTFTPSYSLPVVQIVPNFMLNQSKSSVTDVRTDTYTINLDLRSKFLQDRLSCDLGGTYTIMQTNNDTMDMRNLMANFRVGYSLQQYLKALANPSIALRGTYVNSTDRINHLGDKDEFMLFLVFATAVPLSF